MPVVLSILYGVISAFAADGLKKLVKRLQEKRASMLPKQ